MASWRAVCVQNRSAAVLYDSSFNISSLISTYSPFDLSGLYEQTHIIESGYSATELYDMVDGSAR